MNYIAFNDCLMKWHKMFIQHHPVNKAEGKFSADAMILKSNILSAC